MLQVNELIDTDYEVLSQDKRGTTTIKYPNGIMQRLTKAEFNSLQAENDKEDEE